MGNSSTTPTSPDITVGGFLPTPTLSEISVPIQERAGPSAAVIAALPAVEKLCEMGEDEFHDRFYFEERDPIGKGSFGEVYRGTDKLTGQPIAVKVINLDVRVGVEPLGASEADIRDFRRRSAVEECEILVRIQEGGGSPFVLTVLGGHYPGGDKLYLIYPFMGGDLFDYFSNLGRTLSDDEAKHVFRQAVLAVKYLHDQNIVHRDIKLENFLVERIDVPPDQLRLKIADFGFSTYQSPDSPNLEDFPGSPAYSAPELIKGIPYRGRETDVWALGVTLYIFLKGGYPFYSETVDEMKTKIISLQAPSYRGLSLSQVGTVNAMLNKSNPDLRPSVEDLLTGEFLRVRGDFAKPGPSAPIQIMPVY